MENDTLRSEMSSSAKDNAPWFQMKYVAEMWRSLFDELMNNNP